MLDSDVAMLYHYETKRINETVRRNKERFPINFCFQLTEDETENYGGRRTLPYVFTEQGIAMLSAVLRSDSKSNPKSRERYYSDRRICRCWDIESAFKEKV